MALCKTSPDGFSRCRPMSTAFAALASASGKESSCWAMSYQDASLLPKQRVNTKGFLTCQVLGGSWVVRSRVISRRVGARSGPWVLLEACSHIGRHSRGHLGACLRSPSSKLSSRVCSWARETRNCCRCWTDGHAKRETVVPGISTCRRKCEPGVVVGLRGS